MPCAVLGPRLTLMEKIVRSRFSRILKRTTVSTNCITFIGLKIFLVAL